MLGKIAELVDHMNGAGIRYCHWKSNWALPAALDGGTDLDLLIHRHDAPKFRHILRELGFEPSIEAGSDPLPAVEHHHALDDRTNSIAHVHAYYRVISGESLAKNYRLPVEDMLLTNPRQVDGVAVPAAGAELIIFVLRMLVKHTTPVELALFLRDRDSFEREVAWLMTEAAHHEARALLPMWLPQIDLALFEQGYEALRAPDPVWRRIRLGLRIKRRLRGYARRHPLRAHVIGLSRFGERLWHRLRGSKKKLTPGSGGAVIAFVGSEATGKSTVIAETADWLSQHFTVRQIHAGKPPPTPLTLVPHRLLPLLRRLLPEHRSTEVETRHRAGDLGDDGYSLVFALRSVMLGYERHKLLTRAFVQAANGTIVLSDRYPPLGGGTIDGSQLAHLAQPPDQLRRFLAGLESGLYREMPRPDLVVRLTAPLEIVLERNAARAKVEDADFVRLRHSMAAEMDFGQTPSVVIDTNRPLEQVLGDVKQAIWNAL